MGISYDKAWRAREFSLSSIRGSLEESYSAFPSYCYVLEQKNPGTITDIVIDHDNQFKYFFYGSWCMYFWVSYINKACHYNQWNIFEGKYLGILFVVACKNGNNQIYPLCFGIGDSENDASWEWFLKKLH